MANTPKMSALSLGIKNNYYIVPEAGLFHYFPVKFDETTLDSPVVRFTKSPPVLIEGVVVIKKKLYEVIIDDLLRGVVRKSREITIKKESRTNGSTSAQPISDSSARSGTSAPTSDFALPGTGELPSTVRNPDNNQSEGPSGLEVSTDADAAWEEQIDALLHFISEKEGVEWEVADAP